MLRIKCLVVAAILALTPMANGQAVAILPQDPPAVAEDLLRPASLAERLKKQGFAVDEVKTKNGGTAVLKTKVKKGTWRYQVDIEFSGKELFGFTCTLANPTKYSSEQLLALLKANYDMSPYHFVFRESDKMLLLEGALQPTDITVEEFDELLEGFMKTVRDTYPLWSGKANKTAAAQRAVDEKVNDVPKPTPVVPQVQPAARGLAKTIWSGTEDLGGKYGNLAFRFTSESAVVMIDADGETPGTYSIQNNRVTLQFYNDTVTYTGTMNGQAITGTASNGQSTWSFSIKR